MSFLLHWSTYLFSTVAEAIRLGFFVAMALGPSEVVDELADVDGDAVEFNAGQIMILEALPGDNGETDIIFAQREGGVVEELLSLILDFEPLLEVVEMMAPVGVDFDFEMVDPLQELRPVMMTELNFVRQIVPELTLDQKQNIMKSAEDCLKQAADKAARSDDPALRPVLGILLDSPGDIRDSLRLAIVQKLKEALPGDRFDRFLSLSEFGQSQRKKAAILGMVSRLDGELFLSQSQREQLINEISSQWDSRWSNTSDMFQLEDGVSRILDAVIMSCLDEAQQAAWKSLRGSELEETLLGVENAEDQIAENDGWWGEATPLAEPPVDTKQFGDQ